MVIVRIDEKGRIHLPKSVRESLHLKVKQPIHIGIRRGEVILKKPRSGALASDPLLKDMIERPLKLKGIKLTKKLLKRLEEEQWSE